MLMLQDVLLDTGRMGEAVQFVLQTLTVQMMIHPPPVLLVCLQNQLQQMMANQTV